MPFNEKNIIAGQNGRSKTLNKREEQFYKKKIIIINKTRVK